jgi:hypothetical protein
MSQVSVKLSFTENFIISGAAACLSKTVAAPIERVKLLIQNQGELINQKILDRPYKGITDCAVRTFKSEGFHALWRGNTGRCYTLIMILIYYFYFFNEISNYC